MNGALRWLLPLCLLALGGCLGRAADLLEHANAQVIITGQRAGDRLRLEVAGEQRELLADDEEPLVVWLELPAGEHRGEVRSLEEAPRCAPFTLALAEEGDLDVASVDLRSASPCTEEPERDAGPSDDDGGPGQPDAGPGEPDAGPGEPDAGPLPALFLELEEVVSVTPCLELLCEEVTTVTAEGTVSFDDLLGQPVTGSVAPEDTTALAAQVLSAAADALFAGEDPACAQPRPAGLLGEVTLERSFIPAGADEEVRELLDVSGCDGVAGQLRARLSLLRELGLP